MGGSSYNPELAALREKEMARAGETGSDAVHGARDLDYVPGTREIWWSRLRAEVRNRLTETAGGEITEWWAAPAAEGQPLGVVLGPAALCRADPGVKPDGQPGHRIRTARLTPGSVRVTARGNPVAQAAGPTATAGPAGVPRLASSLSADFTGFLGNLPARTQQSLQEPFRARPDLRYSYYYERCLGPTAATWLFLCYIADDRTLAFGSGTQVTAAATGAAGVWDVTCYQADLTGPMPA